MKRHIITNKNKNYNEFFWVFFCCRLLKKSQQKKLIKIFKKIKKFYRNKLKKLPKKLVSILLTTRKKNTFFQNYFSFFNFGHFFLSIFNSGVDFFCTFFLTENNNELTLFYLWLIIVTNIIFIIFVFFDIFIKCVFFVA